MANKKTKQKPQKGGNKKQVTPSASTPGAGVAFAMALASTVGLFAMFLPWYSDKDGLTYGYHFLTKPGELPAPLRDNMDLFPGPLLFVLLAGTAIIGIGLGFFWPKLTVQLRTWAAEALSIIGAGALLWGLIVLLGLLDMQVLPNIKNAGIVVAAAMFLQGLFAIGVCAAVDRTENRGDAALSGSDWFIWLGGLALTALFHYLVVCYKVVLPAPQTLASKLNMFR